MWSPVQIQNSFEQDLHQGRIYEHNKASEKLPITWNSVGQHMETVEWLITLSSQFKKPL